VQDLARRGILDPTTVTDYALGRIVIWVRSDTPLDVRAGLGAFADPRIRFIAIANPRHAPYGAAAEQALRRHGLYDRVQARLVYGDNISQTLQLVQSGNADVGITALSLAVAPSVAPTGRFSLIPPAAHDPIRQAAAVSARSAHPALARGFLRVITSTQGQHVLMRYGFAVPRGAP
jgi:molybdate transport system substrate-binding protein